MCWGNNITLYRNVKNNNNEIKVMENTSLGSLHCCKNVQLRPLYIDRFLHKKLFKTETVIKSVHMLVGTCSAF